MSGDVGAERKHLPGAAEVVAVAFDFLVSEGYHANYERAEFFADKFAAQLAPLIAARVEAAKAEALAPVLALIAPAWRPNQGYMFDSTSEAYAAGRNDLIDDLRAALDPGARP